MGFVSKIKGDKHDERSQPTPAKLNMSDLTHGALDTLSNVLRVMGSASFPLDSEIDAVEFPTVCVDFARHVENGAAVPSHAIQSAADGQRAWTRVQRFFADRRQAETAFVNERLQGYRSIVDDLVGGLREIGARDQTTETDVLRCLTSIEDAVSSGELPEIQAVLSQTLLQVQQTFKKQRDAYELQLRELNDRMSSMQQDLVAVREEMKRDSLTEAFNRGAFDTAIEQSVNAFFILRQPLTLLMIDIDEFKRINDTWGHTAGDDVLRAVGECLARSFVRRNDLIARYGGDEFAVILSDTSARQAAKIVDRYLRAIRKLAFSFGDDSVQITCSVGYTEIVEDDTVDILVARADRALYQAKAEGRNRAILNDADSSQAAI